LQGLLHEGCPGKRLAWSPEQAGRRAAKVGVIEDERAWRVVGVG